MLNEHAQHAVLPATSAPPQKFHDLVERNTKTTNSLSPLMLWNLLPLMMMMMMLLLLLLLIPL